VPQRLTIAPARHSPRELHRGRQPRLDSSRASGRVFPLDTVTVIVSLVELALAVVVGVFAWQLNHRISLIDNQTVRVVLRVPLNAVATAVILLLLLFALFSSG